MRTEAAGREGVEALFLHSCRLSPRGGSSHQASPHRDSVLAILALMKMPMYTPLPLSSIKILLVSNRSFSSFFPIEKGRETEGKEDQVIGSEQSLIKTF